jgi:hypothetical protein
MYMHEIPRRDWRTKFDALNRAYIGSHISVDLLSPRAGAQTQVLELPLAGIAVERRGPHAAIAITVASGSQTFITHVIKNPMRVFVERTEDEGDIGVQVEAADAKKTILRFHARVDGRLRGLSTISRTSESRRRSFEASMRYRSSG